MKKYTKKQICEALQHWSKVLKIMNESNDAEDTVVNVLHQIITDSLKAQGIKNAYKYVTKIKGHPFKHMVNSPNVLSRFNIFHAGNKDSSDIYINIPIPRKIWDKTSINDVKYVGIEVKENIGSKLFNPQLSYDGHDLSYQNEYSDEMNKIELMDFEDELVPEEYKNKMTNILDSILLFFKDLNFNISEFPFNFRDIGYDTQAQFLENVFWRVYDKIELANGKIADKNTWTYPDVITACNNQKFKVQTSINGHKALSRLTDIVDVGRGDKMYSPTKLRACIENVLFNRTKSINLGRYKILDNHLIKSYFNTIRSNSSKYLPVQFIQYGDILYKLIDDGSVQSRFFKNNGSYRIIPYDQGFAGINVSWKLDFSQKLSDSKIRIKGDITSIQNIGNAVSLTDYNHHPLVSIPKNYSKYIEY